MHDVCKYNNYNIIDISYSSTIIAFLSFRKAIYKYMHAHGLYTVE